MREKNNNDFLHKFSAHIISWKSTWKLYNNKKKINCKNNCCIEIRERKSQESRYIFDHIFQNMIYELPEDTTKDTTFVRSSWKKVFFWKKLPVFFTSGKENRIQSPEAQDGNIWISN